MIRLSPQRWATSRRLPALRLRYLLPSLILWAILALFFLGAEQEWTHPGTLEAIIYRTSTRMPTNPAGLEPLAEPVSCYGARGHLLSDSPDDELHYERVSTSYPVPFIGSQAELGIDRSWMTADGRYGPYGYGQDSPTYNRSVVDWNSVDWGNLQQKCLERNAHRFPNTTSIRTTSLAQDVRFELFEQRKIPATPSWHKFEPTRRTAIVLRAYQGFEYTEENMWNIRSIITEAALQSGGEYEVILLVNIFDRQLNITGSRENYEKALEGAGIPNELRSIALLWDDQLLESWYSAVDEHRSMWQINQPLQLLALHYPEFDHFWQLEMDQRFMGHVGEYMKATAKFARQEPRKQALERATYPYSEELWTSYQEFSTDVDKANNGSSRAWGPVEGSGIYPIGPRPPTDHATEDDFDWGVGEEADVIVTSFCADARGSSWVFRDWILGNFANGANTPRWFCPPAITRGSRPLLLAVHNAQHTRGLSVPSEAVLPSFALWHGLKLSYPPQPVYMHAYDEELAKTQSDDENEETSRLKTNWRHPEKLPFVGYHPKDSPDGLSHANPQSFANRGLTWWWASEYPRNIMDVWLYGNVNNGTTEDLPGMLATERGQVFAPNFVMHPVKT
ncbi:unnamed protein product [Clonostachys rhizophaga]|uniref:Uncharacterized protein n=1 Tax=Clonostachys rhizophaga TaxID=160324 RepID=A0A9N9V4J5_9HYPO|nr:unnamed protein product [Clonostachys rhizophaga]